MIQKAAEPMPSWGPAAAENRKGRYALRPEDMLPVYPSIIQLSEDKTKFNGFTNSAFTHDNDFPEPPPPVYNGFGGGVNKKKDDASGSSLSNSGD